MIASAGRDEDRNPAAELRRTSGGGDDAHMAQ
jgi:hypothetical protein